MANAQQPTKRTRHMDIKKFSLLDWVEQDLLTLHRISTHDNAADHFTKSLAKQLFHRHSDTIMGRRVPHKLVRSNQVLASSVNLLTSSSALSTTSLSICPEHGGVRGLPSVSTYISIG
jgi:hypothetical protein